MLANLFMHYAFDTWLEREFPTVVFERFADDAVVHCVTERQARAVLAALADRMVEVGLALHPDKTRIVYCKDRQRRGWYPLTSFTFPVYTFQPREARRPGSKPFLAFTPAVSPQAMAKMGREVRRWRVHLRTGLDVDELAERVNPIVAGWMNYYGRFHRSRLYPLLQRINTYLMRWAGRKYQRLRSYRRFTAWWSGIIDREPGLFTHWRWVRTFAGFR